MSPWVFWFFMSKEAIEHVSHTPVGLANLLGLVCGRLHLLMSKGTSHQTLNTTLITLGELVICLGLIENLAPCNILFQNLGSPKGKHLPVKRNSGTVGISLALPVRAAPGQTGKWVWSSVPFFLTSLRSAASVSMLFSETWNLMVLFCLPLNICKVTWMDIPYSQDSHSNRQSKLSGFVK